MCLVRLYREPSNMPIWCHNIALEDNMLGLLRSGLKVRPSSSFTRATPPISIWRPSAWENVQIFHPAIMHSFWEIYIALHKVASQLQH